MIIKKIKILASYSELDFILIGFQNYNSEIKGYWFLAPDGYCWKWHYKKCYYNFEWVELEKIKN